MFFLVLFIFLSEEAQSQVPNVTYTNPIAGFSMVIPEDWEIATATAGQVEISIDAPTGASLLYYPLLWFFYAEVPPENNALLLSQALQASGGYNLSVHPTARAGEWEVLTTLNNDLLGEIRTRWLCRQENSVNYVIAAMVRAQFANQFENSITTAFNSCHLIGSPALRDFLEPTENAYRLRMPQGWKWEGQIIRNTNIPGYFTWKAQSNDGLSGCFVSPPAVFGRQVGYVPASSLASTFVLQELQKQVPNLRLEGIHQFREASAYFVSAIKAPNPTMNPLIEKVYADYVGSINGRPVRIRAYLLTWLPDTSAFVGLWYLFVNGAWAPIDNFDQQYAVARGVMTSLSETREWKKRQARVVKDVMTYRNSVAEEAFAEWDEYIRGVD